MHGHKEKLNANLLFVEDANSRGDKIKERRNCPKNNDSQEKMPGVLSGQKSLTKVLKKYLSKRTIIMFESEKVHMVHMIMGGERDIIRKICTIS
mgnify:CR=1 FL=1